MDKEERKKLVHIVMYGNKKQERIDAYRKYLTWKPSAKREKIEKEVSINIMQLNRWRDLDGL